MAARRELRWIAGAAGVVLVALVTAPWAIGVLERLDALTAGVLVLGVTGILVATRHRRGRGWTVLRGLTAAAVVVAVVLAALIAGCVATGCVG